MKTKIQKWGNSLALRIPKSFAEETGLSADTPVELTMIDGALLIRPVPKAEISLKALLRGITDENRHDEVDWGPPHGREAW